MIGPSCCLADPDRVVLTLLQLLRAEVVDVPAAIDPHHGASVGIADARGDDSAESRIVSGDVALDDRDMKGRGW